MSEVCVWQVTKGDKDVSRHASTHLHMLSFAGKKNQTKPKTNNVLWFWRLNRATSDLAWCFPINPSWAMVLHGACIDWIVPAKLSKYILLAATGNNYFNFIYMWCVWLSFISILSECPSEKPSGPFCYQKFLIAWSDNNWVKVREEEEGLGWINLYRDMEDKERLQV